MTNRRVSPAYTTALLLSALLVSSSARAQTTWQSVDVGNTGVSGTASESNGTWTISGGGADVWGSSDAFHYVYRNANARSGKLVVRVDDLQATQPFAKAGVMLRDALTPAAASVILDVKPNGEVEFMQRSADGGEMSYLGGLFTGAPVWLQLWWENGTVVASTSANGRDWNTLGETQASMTQSLGTVIGGAVVCSHDVTQAAIAHVEGLSVMPNLWTSTDIGTTGVTGNVAYDDGTTTTTIEGAGADVWGAADSFQFVHQNAMASTFALQWRVLSVNDTSPFAKAGLMFRDGVEPTAMSVILDVKPDGGIEFMARTCAGCDTTFIAGATMTFPTYLKLARDGSTITASAGADPDALVPIGSIELGLPSSIDVGFAVTSHDPGQVTTAVYALHP